MATEFGFILYLIILLGIGIYAYKFSHTLEDFILAGRKLGPWVIALSAQASDMSGWLLLGLPGEAYKTGLGIIWVVAGCLIGTWFNWSVIARRLRNLTGKYQALTLPDFFEARFGGVAGFWLRLTSLFTVIIFYAFYIAAQFKAGGKTLATVFPFSYHQALFLSSSIIILYTLLGGFFAVAWTDFFQGILMVIVAVVVPVIGMLSVGGLEAILARMSSASPAMMNPDAGLSGWELFGGLILGGLAWGLGYPGQPHILVRFMALKEEDKMGRAMGIAMVWVVIALFGSMLAGFVGFAYFGAGLQDPETCLIMLSQKLLPGWLLGVVIAGITAAIMSTVDSQMLVLTSALVEDFYRRFLNQKASQRLSVFLSRTATLMIGVIALGLAWNAQAGVFRFVQYAWGGLAAGFGPALIASLYFKKVNGYAVALGMILGIATILIWHNISWLAHLCWELIPAFLISLFVIWLGSRLQKEA